MTAPFESISIADVARFPRPGAAMPMRLGFSPDGRTLCYLASSEGNLVLSLWGMDVASGETRLLAGPPPQESGAISREEELRRERARLREVGVTSYHFARKAHQQTLLVPTPSSLTVSVGEGAFEAIPGSEGALDARLSPDGTQVAFVRNGELFAGPLAGGEPRQLSSGAEDGLTNGAAEFIAAEELGRNEGFWWSPDSSRIAYIQADSRQIPSFPIVHQGAPEPEVEYHRYPFAGDANSILHLAVVDVASGETRWLDLGPDTDIYIARVNWRPDGALVVQRLSRDQRTLDLLLYEDGTTEPRTLLTEHTEPWLNVHDDLRFLDGGGFVWSSERDGFRHLYVYDAEGALERQLTSGDWMVTRVTSLDENGGHVYFEATRESVLERHLYRVPLAGGDVERLTSDPGWHTTVVSPKHDSFVDVHSTMDHAPCITLRPFGEGQPRTIFANEGNSAANLGLAPPELRTLTAPNGMTLHGAIYHPPGKETAPAPLLVSVYGGPHAQRVMDEWNLTVDLRAQYLARQGFRVLKLDNRGSANRGLAFEAELNRRMGTVEVEDQAAAVRQLIAEGLADEGRTGIYGWSYGGYMTIMCMLRQPGLFRAGVAGAPVTDWDGYDTGYTERYMGTPGDNPDGYREGSTLTHAAALEGKLLLVHGGIDENVHFRHTARFIVALTNAGKPYDLLFFPAERHMPRDQKGLEYQESRLAEYFAQHL